MSVSVKPAPAYQTSQLKSRKNDLKSPNKTWSLCLFHGYPYDLTVLNCNHWLCGIRFVSRPLTNQFSDNGQWHVHRMDHIAHVCPNKFVYLTIKMYYNFTLLHQPWNIIMLLKQTLSYVGIEKFIQFHWVSIRWRENNERKQSIKYVVWTGD